MSRLDTSLLFVDVSIFSVNTSGVGNSWLAQQYGGVLINNPVGELVQHPGLDDTCFPAMLQAIDGCR